MRPGPLIAIDVLCLYALLSPMVLFGIYVFFDWIGQSSSAEKTFLLSGKTSEKKIDEKEPCLWAKKDITAYLNRG